MVLQILALIVGFAFLIYGADILVKGASNIAKRFHIPEIIIGLTIVAIGTSMPELIITVTSAIKGHTDLIIGNAIGSNLCNLLLILGFISVIKPVKIDKQTRHIHLPISIISTVLLLIMVNGFAGTEKFLINKPEGFFLILFAVIYFIYPIYIEIKDIVKTNEEEKKEHIKNKINVLKSIFSIILGVILLKYGSDFVVESAVLIAENFGLSEKVIGLTIIAIGTALPEMVTSIVALIKKDTDMAVRKLSWLMCIKFMFNNWYRSSNNPIYFCTKF